MWYDELEKRNTINLPSDVTFGVEIEFAKASKLYVEDEIETGFKNNILNKNWKVENEKTLYESGVCYSIYGGEAVSDILVDSKSDWNGISYVCDSIKKYRGKINQNCGAHVHIGENIFAGNLKYYARFMKLWTIYEEIITKFCFGEYNTPRKSFYSFSGSCTNLFKHIDLFYKNDKVIRSFDEFISCYSRFKNEAVSFYGVDKQNILKKYGSDVDWEHYKTIEFRAGNGTLNPVIWQNYVNLYTKLMLTCLDDSKDWDMIDKLFYKNIEQEDFSFDINIPKALEFVDLIFDNNVDKEYFLTQYLKKDKSDTKKLIKRMG